MAHKIHKTAQPVMLDGFQAILKPSEYGYKLEAVFTDESLIETLNTEREELLTSIQSKIKNPKRAVLKPEPWEEVASGQYKVKFGWKATEKPTIVDSEGTLITDEDLKIYSGSKVRLAFVQKPYLMKDGITYGTSVKLSGIQLISLGNASGTPSLTADEASDFFGAYEGGFSVDDIPPADTEDDEEGGESEAEDKEF
jgi:hypothetical protein